MRLGVDVRVVDLEFVAVIEDVIVADAVSSRLVLGVPVCVGVEVEVCVGVFVDVEVPVPVPV